MNGLVITKRLEFDAGHRLMNHEGKCRNLHGHRWAAEISVSGDALDSVGRVIDFGEIKSMFGGWIDKYLDHNMILCEHDADLIEAIKPFCKDKQPYVMKVNPTSENLAVELKRVFSSMLAPVYGASLRVERVRLYETPTSCAETW